MWSAGDAGPADAVPTTDAFLKHFGMETIEDLPSIDLNQVEGEIGV